MGNKPKTVLIAAAWPYANGPRHLGHVSSFALPADISARYHRLRGDDVLFVSGTDEHGTPISVLAEKEGCTPQEVVDRYSHIIRQDLSNLGISYDLFTRTTTGNHADVVRQVLQALLSSGLVFERETLGAFAENGRALPDRFIEGICPHCSSAARGDQCDSCGAPLDPTDLIEPRSSVDGSTPQWRPSRHLALNLPLLQDWLVQWTHKTAENNAWRHHVVAQTQALVSDLVARDITRDLDWGVSIDRDGFRPSDGKRLYVWFEAVIGYLSASIEARPEDWQNWWQSPDAIHNYYAGSDNVYFHSILWPAILYASKQAYGELHLPDNVVATQYLTFGGEQFSTSRGNVISVNEALEKWGVDALRYTLICSSPENKTSEFSDDLVKQCVNGELLGKWGNAVQRILAFSHKRWKAIPAASPLTDADNKLLADTETLYATVGKSIEAHEYRAALKCIFKQIDDLNKYIDACAPWKEDEERCQQIIFVAASSIHNINLILSPFLPHLANAVSQQFGDDDIAPLPQENKERITTSSGKAQWEYHNINPGKIDKPSGLVARI